MHRHHQRIREPATGFFAAAMREYTSKLSQAAAQRFSDYYTAHLTCYFISALKHVCFPAQPGHRRVI